MHEVILTERAQAELDHTYHWWAKNRSLEQADRWYVGIVQEMLTLEQSPERGPLAPENELFPFEVRQLTYGLGNHPTHRALYTVRADTVVILRIRHLAQNPLTEAEATWQ